MPVHLLSLIYCALLPISLFSLDANSSQTQETDAKKEVTKEESTSKKTDTTNVILQPMPIDYGVQHKQDLKHYITKEQVKPLLAGPDDYLTLVNKYTTANSNGAAILLPDWQQGATNPKAINFLRTALPDNGWTTITIQPNAKPDNYPSMALTVTEQQEQNKLLLTEYKNKLTVMLNSAMERAKDYPGIVLIIAQGNNGALLVDILSNNADNNIKLTEPNALILLSSYRQTSRELQQKINNQFAESIALLELPLLDLYLTYDHPLVNANMPKRVSLSAQEMQVYYRQRQLKNATSGYYPHKELMSQINGWLKAIGW